MKTANELRNELANKQRMQKTRDKWLELADRVNSLRCWQSKTQLADGCKIGDKVGFVDVKSCRGGFTCTQKYGTAFAFGEKTMLLVYRGQLKKVDLDKVTEDMREILD